MPSTYISPFDFRKIMNYFIGTDTLFAFLFLLIYSYAAAYFGMPNKVYYSLLVFAIVLFGVFFGESIYILALLLIGGFIFKQLADYFRR